MSSKLAIIAATGITVCVVCLGAAAVLQAPHWNDIDWENLDIGFNSCKTIPGATATTRQLDWPGDDRIAIGVRADAHYTPGTAETINASGDPQSIAHLRVRHHTIELDCNGHIPHSKLDITLPGREFHSFTVAGSGKLDLNQLDQPSVDVTVAGSGTVRTSGKTDMIKFKIAGSGTVEASGTADTVRLIIAGSGDGRLGELAVKVADIDIAGSGSAVIAPQDEAKIKIAGSGEVRLVTEPKSIDTKIAGSGRIIHGAAHPD